MTTIKTLIATAAAVLATGAAQADITIGISLPLTGPASGLGIPANNQIKLWPTTIAGEKLKVVVLDDGTDPTNGIKNAKRFVTDDKVDIIMGSVATPVAIPIAGVRPKPRPCSWHCHPCHCPPAKTAGPSACPSPTPSWRTPSSG